MKTTTLEIIGIHAFDNEEYEGLQIEWRGNTGWGQCDIYRAQGSWKWMANTEHMGRDFLKMLLEKLADKVEIVE